MQTIPDRKSRPINNVDHQTEATVVSTVFAKQDKVMDMLRSLTIRLDTLGKVVKSSAEEQLQGRHREASNDRTQGTNNLMQM